MPYLWVYKNGKAMTKTKFTFRVVCIQGWNNDHKQIISEHKSLENAEKMVRACSKKNYGNTYLIEEVE